MLPIEVPSNKTKTLIHLYLAHHSEEKSSLLPIQINLQLYFLSIV